MAPKPILIANNLSLGYGNTKIAENISFELQEGLLTCLMGPNGVGKSTLIKAIMGTNPPLNGEILLDGVKLATIPRVDLAKIMAVVLTDKIPPGSMTVSEMVALGRVPHTGWWGRLKTKDRDLIEQVMEATHLNYLKDRKLGEISDGQLQKVMIARALAQEGKIIILDEPTAHLDLINRFEIMHLLRKMAKEASKAILVVTHDLEIAIETADCLWLMTCGNALISDSPEDLMVSGAINQLLPGNKWGINPISGKIESIERINLPIISGPENLVHWVKSAIKKQTALNLSSDLEIILSSSPFSIKVLDKGETTLFKSISALMAFLSDFKNTDRDYLK